MNDNLAAVVITALLSGSILLGLLGRALFGARRGKSVDAGSTIVPDRLRVIEERMAHLQQSVDAIAVEVERVSEGQRFTTKLLADRGTPVGRGEQS